MSLEVHPSSFMPSSFINKSHLRPGSKALSVSCLWLLRYYLPQRYHLPYYLLVSPVQFRCVCVLVLWAFFTPYFSVTSVTLLHNSLESAKVPIWYRFLFWDGFSVSIKNTLRHLARDFAGQRKQSGEMNQLPATREMNPLPLVRTAQNFLADKYAQPKPYFQAVLDYYLTGFEILKTFPRSTKYSWEGVWTRLEWVLVLEYVIATCFISVLSEKSQSHKYQSQKQFRVNFKKI